MTKAPNLLIAAKCTESEWSAGDKWSYFMQCLLWVCVQPMACMALGCNQQGLKLLLNDSRAGAGGEADTGAALAKAGTGEKCPAGAAGCQIHPEAAGRRSSKVPVCSEGGWSPRAWLPTCHSSNASNICPRKNTSGSQECPADLSPFPRCAMPKPPLRSNPEPILAAPGSALFQLFLPTGKLPKLTWRL